MVRIALVPLAALLLLPLATAKPARADDVDMALVLVTDVSRSIDDSEFKLEKDGYANAFTSQKVLEAIQAARPERSPSPMWNSPAVSRCAPCWIGRSSATRPRPRRSSAG